MGQGRTWFKEVRRSMELPGSVPVTAPGDSAEPKDDLSLIDCGLYRWPKDLNELLPYLDSPYNQQVETRNSCCTTPATSTLPDRQCEPNWPVLSTRMTTMNTSRGRTLSGWKGPFGPLEHRLQGSQQRCHLHLIRDPRPRLSRRHLPGHQ